MPAGKATKRLRIFAGPNGSGKTTIIHSIQKLKVNNRAIDFGTYINADDIANSLRHDSFSFGKFGLKKVTRALFVEMALASGLVSKDFPEEEFRASFSLNAESKFRLKKKERDEQLAQIIADFLRKSLLGVDRKLSFETVFSHPAKIEFMRHAKDKGYKVYLYFIATQSPEINVARVKEVRVAQGGHDVPEEKITARYYRSLQLLYDAAELAYQAYFFDNSSDGGKLEHFAHFKVIKGRKVWDDMDETMIPNWFFKYYLGKYEY